MAEFCPECWNKINGVQNPPEAYVLSWEYDLCEGCGKIRRTVIKKRKHYLLRVLLKRVFKQ